MYFCLKTSRGPNRKMTLKGSKGHISMLGRHSCFLRQAALLPVLHSKPSEEAIVATSKVTRDLVKRQNNDSTFQNKKVPSGGKSKGMCWGSKMVPSLCTKQNYLERITCYKRAKQINLNLSTNIFHFTPQLVSQVCSLPE